MKTSLKFCLGAALAAALLAGVPAVRAAMAPTAAADSAGQQVATIDVPAGLSGDDVQDAILKAAVRRKWEVQQKTAEQVVCHYARHENEATLTIKYDQKQVIIFAVGHSRGGGLPMRWIDALAKDIRTFLSEQLALKH